MENLEKFLTDYLSKKTEYAFQINGNWGLGKTFYYRNTLEDLIANTTTPDDASKVYKPIYISLFGLKSIEDIATKIVIEFYQSSIFRGYFIKKKLKITGKILKIALRGFLNFQRLGNINDYITDLNALGKDYLDTNELVICFDDIERKNSSFNIKELTGYINSLVDEGIKVLIISNEDLLLKNEKDYRDLKEKIIGISITFNPAINKLLENIINVRYAGFPTYILFLKEHIEILEEFCDNIQRNFRYVIYSLDNLQSCYSSLKMGILDIEHEIAKELQKNFRSIIIQILAISAEYKSSNINYANSNEYLQLPNSKILNDLNIKQNEVNIDKNQYELFIKKYKIAEFDLICYESILYFTIGQTEFCLEKFIAEFINNFNLEKGVVLYHYQILQSLGYQDCLTLNDNEYESRTLELIDFAKAGFFTPAEYLTVFHFVERFDNILNLDLENVKTNIISGLKLSIGKTETYSELHYSQFEMTYVNNLQNKYFKLIYDVGMEEIKLQRAFKNKSKIESISSLFINNIIDFEHRYYNEIEFPQNVHNSPFLKTILPANLYKLLIESEKKSIQFLLFFIEDRYKFLYNIEMEKEYIKELIEFFTNNIQIEKNDAKIRGYLIKKVVKLLSKIIEPLSFNSDLNIESKLASRT